MKKNRVLCILLSVMIALSMMPMLAYAEEDIAIASYSEPIAATTTTNITVDEDTNVEWRDVCLGSTQTFTLTDDCLIVSDEEGNVISKDDPAYPENILDTLCYQWYKDEDAIEGATGTSYTTEITKRSELDTTFVCCIYKKKASGKRGKKIGEFYFFLSEDTMERFTVGGQLYRANTDVNMDDWAVATIGQSCTLDSTMWFNLQKWNGKEWKAVPANDRHWNCTWKRENKTVIPCTKPAYTIKKVKQSDIQSYKVYVKFGNKQLGTDEICVERDTAEYFRIDGADYRGYVYDNFYTVETKIGSTVTLDPENDSFDPDDFYCVDKFLSDEEYPEGTWDLVEDYAKDSSFEWTKGDSKEVLATSKKLKIKVADDSDYGTYYLNVKYRGHFIGRMVCEIAVDNRNYINAGGGTYQHPKKGDMMVDLNNPVDEICAVEGQSIMLNNFDPYFSRYDGKDWDDFFPARNKIKYHWTKDDKPLDEYKNSYISLDVAADDLGSVYKCNITYNKYNVGTYEYIITEGLGLGGDTHIVANQHATEGERVKMVAKGEPNKKDASISYQWYRVNYDYDRFSCEKEYTAIPGATKQTYVTPPVKLSDNGGYYTYCCKYTVHDKNHRLADYTDEYYTDILVAKDSKMELETDILQEVKLDSDITYRFTFTPTESGWYGFEVSDVNWIDMIGVESVESKDPEDEFTAIMMDDEESYKAELVAGQTYYIYAYGYSEDPDRDYTEFNIVAKKRQAASVKKKTVTLKLGKKYNPAKNLKGEKDLYSYCVKSSNRKVVKVVDDKVKALKKGTAKITVYTDEGDFTYKIKVK